MSGPTAASMVGQRDVNPPLASGELTPYFNTGAIALNQNQMLAPNFPGYLDRLVFVTGSGVMTPDGLQCQTATCTLATPDGQADRQSGHRADVVCPHRADRARRLPRSRTARWNPNFANTTSGVTDLDSHVPRAADRGSIAG